MFKYFKRKMEEKNAQKIADDKKMEAQRQAHLDRMAERAKAVSLQLVEDKAALKKAEDHFNWVFKK